MLIRAALFLLIAVCSTGASAQNYVSLSDVNFNSLSERCLRLTDRDSCVAAVARMAAASRAEELATKNAVSKLAEASKESRKAKEDFVKHYKELWYAYTRVP